MATTKTFNNVRLQLKYDSYSAWSTANPVLLAGEIAVTTVPTKGDGVEQVPAVLMKVGDGTSTYNQLKFVSGLAANVHDWALATDKPEYTADEITGLADFISGEIEDTNTTYQIVKVDDYNYKLQYKELNGAWTDVAENGSIVIPEYDDSQVKADIAALQTQIGTGKVEEQISSAIEDLKLADTYAPKNAPAEALNQAKEYTDILANGAVAQNTAAINAIKDGETLDSFADVEASIKSTADTAAEATADALAEAKEYADGKDAAISAAAGAASAAQGDVDDLAAKVGTVTEGKTVVEMIEAAQTAATYDDTEVRGLISGNTGEISTIKADYLKNADKTALQEQITANKDALDVLNGSGEGSVDKKIDDAFNDFATKVSDDNVVNSYKELIDYAAENGQEMVTVAGNIKANADAIDAVEGRADDLEGRMDAAEADIDALEKDSHTHSNKALLDTYTQTEANLADAVAKRHDHANAGVLDGINAEKVANWDAAKTGVDALDAKVGTVAEGKTLVEMIEAAEDAAVEAATYDDTEVRGLIKTNADDIDAVEERVNTLEDNAVLDGDTLILNCGTSANIA